MNREQVLARLNERWKAFNESFRGLTDAQMTQTGTIGEWSIRDTMAHVTVWERECLKVLPMVIEGKRPPRYGGVDNFNDAQYASFSRLGLSQVRSELASTHYALVDYLKTVPEAQLSSETRARHRLRLDTYGHYALHTRAILEWRRTLPDARMLP